MRFGRKACFLWESSSLDCGREGGIVRRGPAIMMLATLAFTVMIASVKWLRSELGALEVVFFRAALSVPLAAVLCRGRVWRVNRPGLLLLRVLLGFAAMGCFFTAVAGLSLADMALVSKLQPVLVVLLAPALLGGDERVGRSIWWVLAAGVVGTALLLGPELAVGNRYGLWALAAAGFSSLAHVALRALRAHASPPTIVFWFQLGSAGLALALLMILSDEAPRWPRLGLWPAIVTCGVAATLGQVLMTRAYAVEKASIVGAASYVGPLWAVAGDALLFAAWPSANALAGGAVIVGAGLWLLRDRPSAVVADGTAPTVPISDPTTTCDPQASNKSSHRAATGRQ